MMPASLLRQLQKAGISSHPLATWLRCCERGTKDECEECWLQGPEGCADTVIASLVDRMVMSAHQTDVALDQRDYWKGVADRMTDVVIGYRSGEEAPDRQRPRVNRVFEEKEST